MSGLHVVTCAPDYLPHIGGAEIGLHTLLERAGATTPHTFTVVVPTDDPSRARREEIDGVHVVRFRRPHRWMNWYLPTLACLAQLPRLMPGLVPDVIHLSYALPSGLGGALAARRAGIPYVLSVGGNDVSDPVYPPPALLQRAAGSVARGADRVICWTTPIQRVVAEQWDVDEKRITVNPFGVDVEPFRSEARRASAAKPNGSDTDGTWGVTFLVVARLERRKGVDVLIRAVAELARLAPDHRFEVVVVGSGRERDRLERMVSELGLLGLVRFVGPVGESEKRRWMAAADVLVVPSRHEGQGIVIAEAAAAGTPSIATRAGGTVDMVDDESSGMLVQADDPHSMAEAMYRAVLDPAMVRTMGQAAAVKASAELSLDHTAAVFVDIVETAARAKA